MHTIQNTLYVMTPNSYARLEDGTLRTDAGCNRLKQSASIFGQCIASSIERARIEIFAWSWELMVEQYG